MGDQKEALPLVHFEDGSDWPKAIMGKSRASLHLQGLIRNSDRFFARCGENASNAYSQRVHVANVQQLIIAAVEHSEGAEIAAPLSERFIAGHNVKFVPDDAANETAGKSKNVGINCQAFRGHLGRQYRSVCASENCKLSSRWNLESIRAKQHAESRLFISPLHARINRYWIVSGLEKAGDFNLGPVYWADNPISNQCCRKPAYRDADLPFPIVPQFKNRNQRQPSRSNQEGY